MRSRNRWRSRLSFHIWTLLGECAVAGTVFSTIDVVFLKNICLLIIRISKVIFLQIIKNLPTISFPLEMWSPSVPSSASLPTPIPTVPPCPTWRLPLWFPPACNKSLQLPQFSKSLLFHWMSILPRPPWTSSPISSSLSLTFFVLETFLVPEIEIKDVKLKIWSITFCSTNFAYESSFCLSISSSTSCSNQSSHCGTNAVFAVRIRSSSNACNRVVQQTLTASYRVYG